MVGPGGRESETVGVVWAVDDEPTQRTMLNLSHASLQKMAPDLDATVFLTQDVDPNLCRGLPIRRLESSESGCGLKYDAWLQSPYDWTLFLDNDTIVLKHPFQYLSRYLDASKPVVALPYPNFLERETIPALDHATIPLRWRNVNSGVVLFHRSFMSIYGEVWEKFGRYWRQLPGRDQCLFSLALHQMGDRWVPDFDLQLTTTHFAVEYVRRFKRQDYDITVGRVPLGLMFDCLVLHYTEDKPFYRRLFSRWFADGSPSVRSCRELALFDDPELKHGARFSPWDLEGHGEGGV